MALPPSFCVQGTILWPRSSPWPKVRTQTHVSRLLHYMEYSHIVRVDTLDPDIFNASIKGSRMLISNVLGRHHSSPSFFRVHAGLMREDTVWDEAWDEEFKKCATRALFQPTPTLTQAYCRVLHGQAARGVGIHVRTGMCCMRCLLSCVWGDASGRGHRRCCEG